MRLKHRNILRALGVSERSSVFKQLLVLETLTAVLAQELVPPPSSDASPSERRAAVKRWPPLRALRYGLELAMALRYLHDEAFSAQGYRVLHRDIKPKNIGLVNDRYAATCARPQPQP